jgi:hypothetical protein
MAVTTRDAAPEGGEEGRRGEPHVRMLDFEAVELVTVVGLCPFL